MRNDILNIYENLVREQVRESLMYVYDDVEKIDKYTMENAQEILKILIENACLGQNYAPIEIAREKIGKMNYDWLIHNFIGVAKTCIDFTDEWEYRRLVEVVVRYIPDIKDEILGIGMSSLNEEVKEVAIDFRDK